MTWDLCSTATKHTLRFNFQRAQDGVPGTEEQLEGSVKAAQSRGASKDTVEETETVAASEEGPKLMQQVSGAVCTQMGLLFSLPVEVACALMQTSQTIDRTMPNVWPALLSQSLPDTGAQRLHSGRSTQSPVQ